MIYHVTTADALPSIFEEGIQPRIGPRSEVLGEAERAIYAFATAEAVEDALCGWLGEALPEDAEIAVLEIDMEAAPEAGSFEVVLLEAVPASLIVRVLDESLAEVTRLAPGAPAP